MDIPDKKNIFYGVKGSGANSVKDVDITKRKVTGILSTYFWIDSDYDMLITGAAKKTIADNGPGSNAIAKIKHQADHKLDTEHIVGKFTVLKEKVIGNKTVIYFESDIPNTTKGNDHLINYQSGLYDQHSIGFLYKNYVVAAKESENENYRENWNKYYPLALNPEVADEYGYFWVIKEIRLYEGSVVMFGANSLTQYLGAKSKDKISVQNDLIERTERIEKMLRNGKLSDEGFKTLQIELLQQKQILSEIDFSIKSDKCTFEKKPKKKSTYDNNFINQLILNI